jgi:hypothetical protein
LKSRPVIQEFVSSGWKPVPVLDQKYFLFLLGIARLFVRGIDLLPLTASLSRQGETGLQQALSKIHEVRSDRVQPLYHGLLVESFGRLTGACTGNSSKVNPEII